MTRQVRSGNGWRLGWNPHAEQFKGMVAGKDWAIELTAAEFKDFCRVAQQLNAAMKSMSEQLMDEERLSCEQETKIIWLEAEGLPTSYSLRFILLTGRKGEGEWPAPAVSALIEMLNQSPFKDLA